jgi:hypothetical protein
MWEGYPLVDMNHNFGAYLDEKQKKKMVDHSHKQTGQLCQCLQQEA